MLLSQLGNLSRESTAFHHHQIQVTAMKVLSNNYVAHTAHKHKLLCLSMHRAIYRWQNFVFKILFVQVVILNYFLTMQPNTSLTKVLKTVNQHINVKP